MKLVIEKKLFTSAFALLRRDELLVSRYHILPPWFGVVSMLAQNGATNGMAPPNGVGSEE